VRALYFILLLFCFCCSTKKEKLISKIYVLKEVQEINHPNSLHKFPIMEEMPTTPEVIKQLNQQLEKKSNFDEFAKGCFEPEFGFRIIDQNKIVKVVLISIKCSRVYVYQNKKKQEYILSQLGQDNFRKIFSENFPQYENKILP